MDAAADRAQLLAQILAKAVVHGRVVLSSGARPTTTWTCGGSPSTAPPPRWSAR